jgi:hypothetical protein
MNEKSMTTATPRTVWALLLLAACKPELKECERAHANVLELDCQEALSVSWYCSTHADGGRRDPPETPECEVASAKLKTCRSAYRAAASEIEAAGGGLVSLDTFVSGGCEVHRQQSKGNDIAEEHTVVYPSRSEQERARITGEARQDSAIRETAKPVEKGRISLDSLDSLEALPPLVPASRHETVRLGEFSVDGPLGEDLVRRIIRAHRSEILYCYNQAGESNGKVRVRFTIDRTGQVSVAAVENAPDAADEVLSPCLTRAIPRWRFPKARSDSVVRASFWPEPAE